MAQNVNLVAESLGLGSLNLGSFFDDRIAALLGIDTDEEVPPYGTGLGVPAQGGPVRNSSSRDDWRLLKAGQYLAEAAVYPLHAGENGGGLLGPSLLPIALLHSFAGRAQFHAPSPRSLHRRQLEHRSGSIAFQWI